MRPYIEMADRLSSDIAALTGISYMLCEIMESITTSADEGEAAKVGGYTAIIANEVKGIEKKAHRGHTRTTGIREKERKRMKPTTDPST